MRHSNYLCFQTIKLMIGRENTGGNAKICVDTLYEVCYQTWLRPERLSVPKII